MEMLLWTTIILVAIIAMLLHKMYAMKMRLRYASEEYNNLEKLYRKELTDDFGIVVQMKKLEKELGSYKDKADVAVGFRVFLDASQMITASDRASDAWNAYIKTQERIEEYCKKKEGEE